MKGEGDWKLKWLAWEVTARCNLNCIHCRCGSSHGGGDGIFSYSRAKALLDEIASFASPVIVLTGGEPLLRSDVADIMAYGTDRGFRMCLATNGTLLNDRICKDLKKAGIKIVSLSLDGGEAAVHDDFRKQKGAFDGTVKGIELLKRHGIPFLITSSFTQRNLSSVPSTCELAKKLGAKAWYMFSVVPAGRGEEISAELLQPDQYRELLKWHMEMERKQEELLVRPTCAPQYYRLLAEAEAAGRPVKHRSLSFSTGGAKGCVAGQSIALVDSEGEVKPCSYFPFSVGNVNGAGLERIWKESGVLRKLRDFSLYKGMCSHCRYLKVCGGCRVRAYFAYGDFLAQDPLCGRAFGPPGKDRG